MGCKGGFSKLIFTLSLLMISVGLKAFQTTADCANLLVVCSNTSLTLNSNGVGVNDFANPNNIPPPCGFVESQSLWLKVPIATNGQLVFTISANNNQDDFDFAVYGPNVSCNNLGTAIRCSSTNPQAAGVSSDTGLRSGELDTSEGPGAQGNGFVSAMNVLAGEEYIILIDNFNQSNAGFQLSWAGSNSIATPPPANKPDDLMACDPDGDGLTTFNLSDVNAQVLAGQPGANVTFHHSEGEAVLGNNPISPLNYTNRVQNERIYARVTRSGSGCSSITDFQLEVFPEPTVDAIMGATSVCPSVTDVPYTVSGSFITIYDWIIEGGTLSFGQNTDSITVDWGAANDNAKVKLVASNGSGCEIDTVVYDVKINRRLEPETPMGPQIVCYAEKDEVTYQVPLVPGSQYDWTVENGSIVSGAQENAVVVRWNDNVNTGRVYFREFNPTITDCEGFSDTLNVQIRNQILVTDLVTEPLCNGDNTGQVALTVSGGDGNLSVVWDNGTVGTVLSNVARGTYGYTINDDVGCTITGEVEVSQPDELTVDMVTPVNTLCFITNDGSAEVAVLGGTGNYTYNWSGPNFSAQTTVNRIADLGRGTYTVVVTDENGCTTSTDFEIGSPPLLEPDLDALINLPICPGASDGEIQIDALGGTPDYQFFWELNTNQTGSIATGLSAGPYQVRIVDANGCEVTLDVEVTEFVPRVSYPTAFTPNGDGENDLFEAVVGCVLPQYSFKLFNRWGEVLFYTENQNVAWDGTFNGQAVPDGTYSYAAFYRVVVNNITLEENVKGSIRVFR